MKILSIQVGVPREVTWRGESITTGIYKKPVAGSVRVRTLNLDGDEQADLSVHGGKDKAVYAYPSEHYEFWRGELGTDNLPWGMFGENLTTDDLLEESVFIGDRYRIGDVELVATQPRLPCYKLGLRFERADMVKRFLASRRTGFYFAVKREGEMKAGDAIERIDRAQDLVSIGDITRIYAFDRDDLETMRAATGLEDLPESWRGYFQARLAKLSR